MYDKPVRSVMQRQKLLKASPQTSVRKAAEQMATRNVGAIMIVDDERLVGIFTERDALTRVMAPGLDPQETTLAGVMTPSPQTVDPDRPFGYALALMHEKGFRHLPVVEGDKVVGIVSSRSAMDPEMEDFVAEAQRREHFQEKG
jgi:CBS domain-containing protein